MRSMQGWKAAAVAAVVLVSFGGAARAASTAAEAEQRRVWDDVGRAALKGPVDVPLQDEAVLHVPAGEVFVPQPEADRLLDLFGNPGSNPEMPGVLLPRDPKASWYMPVRFHKAGYIKDDDARTWDADDMLHSLRVGTDEQNRDREKAGVPRLELEGWLERPRYDAARQRLVWALTSHEVGAKPGAPRTVNYNAFALGRDGYFSMNLVSAYDDLQALRPVAEQQLAALEYKPGRRYADFNASTDPVSVAGLSALVVDAVTPEPGAFVRMRAFASRAGPLAIGGVAALLVVAAAIILVRRKRRAPPVATVTASVDPGHRP
jgi:uncharacterized membrane-anchored protein